MVLSWILYALALGLLLTGAAAATERWLRTAGLEARWTWIGAMFVSVALPGVHLVAPALGGLPAPDVLPAEWAPAALAGGVGGSSSAAAGEGAVPTLPLDVWFPRAWAVLSAAVLAWLGRSAWRLRRICGSSPAWPFGDTVLYRTSRLGPGVVGVRRPRIVVPDWVLEMEDPDRAMILAHEREHVRGKDPVLLHLGWSLLALVPWLLPLWWQFRRLRLAVELDCDQRVVERVGNARAYGRILVQAKRFSLGLDGPLVTSGDAFLGRRVRRLAKEGSDCARSRLRVAVPAAVALAALAAAALLPPPVPAAATSPEPYPSPVGEEVFSRLDGSFDRAPRLRNREEARALIRSHHPEELRRRGVGGEVLVIAHVAADGRVTGGFVSVSSGYRELDRAAVEVAGALRFAPAEEDGEPTAVWWGVPLRFRIE